MNVHL